jgi:hypothetical protein
MVEKYYSFDPPISKQEFCNNYSRTRIETADFEEWISLYENLKNEALELAEEINQKKKKNKISSKEKVQLKPNCNVEKIKRERNRLSHLKQIRYYKSVVKTGKFSFSKDPKKQKSRVQMFLEKENPFKIYKLALILSEDLNDAEFKIELLLEELKKHNLDIPKAFFNFHFTNKNSLPIEPYIDEDKSDLASVVFEIDPAKNGKISLQNNIAEKKDLNLLCERSISDLQSTLVGVYKILEGLQS